MIYANPGNQPQIADILYLMGIKTHGAKNHKIFSLHDLDALVVQYNASKVMFHRTDLPQRAVSIEKARPVIERLIREEIDRLKADWCADPCWDIEFTEGFEEHEDELLAHRLAMEATWKKERQAEIIDKAGELSCSLALAEYILHLEYELDKIRASIE